jgi:hypothetical protein
MAEEEKFAESHPYLFGRGFAKKAKGRAEALECRRRAKAKTKAPSLPQKKNKSFYGNSSDPNGGGSSGNYFRCKEERIAIRTRTTSATDRWESRRVNRKPQESGRLNKFNFTNFVSKRFKYTYYFI